MQEIDKGVVQNILVNANIMNSYKNLFNNTIVYFIGILGSKLISFVLVPVYTYYLTTEQYGTVDLITVAAATLMPIVTLCMYEAVLRFSLDKSTNKVLVINNALFIFSISYVVFILLSPIFLLLDFDWHSILYLYLLVLFEGLSMIFAQYARSLGHSKLFAVDGILKTLATGILNIVFIVFLNLGIRGYMLALIISYIGSTLFLSIKTQAIKHISKDKIEKSLAKVMLKYTLPLVPNNIMWSLINSSSKFIINYNLGVGANGLYAVSTKIPTIINMGSTVFSQAWQLSIIEEYEENKNTESFYSNVFEIYSTSMLILLSILIVIIKPLFSLLFSNEYFDGWKPVPFLLLGAVFSAFSGFIGSAYTVSKQTSGTLKTSIYGGVISLVTNFLLIPRVGLIGAGISSMISYFTMFVIRFFDTREYTNLEINWNRLILTLILVMLQSVFLFVPSSISIETVVELVLLLVLLTINRSVISKIFKLGFRIIKSLKNNYKST